MSNAEHLFGNGRRFSKKVIRFVWRKDRSSAGRVNGRVHNELGNMNSLGSVFPRDGLGQNALRCLGRGEITPMRFSPSSSSVAGHHNCAVPRF